MIGIIQFLNIRTLKFKKQLIANLYLALSSPYLRYYSYCLSVLTNLIFLITLSVNYYCISHFTVRNLGIERFIGLSESTHSVCGGA